MKKWELDTPPSSRSILCNTLCDLLRRVEEYASILSPEQGLVVRPHGEKAFTLSLLSAKPKDQ